MVLWLLSAVPSVLINTIYKLQVNLSILPTSNLSILPKQEPGQSAQGKQLESDTVGVLVLANYELFLVIAAGPYLRGSYC